MAEQNSNRRQRIERLLQQAMAMQGAQRLTFLADECGDDRQLRKELETLLDFAGVSPGERLPDEGVETRSHRVDLDGKHSTTRQGLRVRCPYCGDSVEIVIDMSLTDLACASCGSHFSLAGGESDTRAAQSVASIGHFELLERLGLGSFGAVWKARDTELDRTVAIKIPRKGHLDDVETEKFLREARATAQLRHPHIVNIHEVGRHGDIVYIVSDFVRGVSLSDWLADQRLTPRQSAELCAKMAESLEYAHQAGVIHRDLKPQNILIDADGEPHLMDFGLARRESGEITVTVEGQVIGTPAYMSPEQAKGEAHKADRRSDVYSLGVILFQLLTGELPFRGSSPMLLHKVINSDPPGPRTLDGLVPKDLDTACLKCLEKSPARRYATAGDLASDLRRYLSGQPIAARPVRRSERVVRWARRNPTVSLLLAATLCTLLIASIVSSYFGWNAAQQEAAVTKNLYDTLVKEIQLTRQVREQGYGDKVERLVHQARNLSTPRVDLQQLRYETVLAMGDFVAYPATAVDSFPDDISAVCLSPDNRELIVGLAGGQLFTHDAANGRRISRIEPMEGLVDAIAFMGSDDELITADKGGLARSWRRAGDTWQAEHSFRLGEAPYSIRASRDGQWLAFVKNNRLELWNASQRSLIHKLATNPGWEMRNAAFDLDNGRVAGAFLDQNSDSSGWALWELESGKRIHEQVLPSLGNSYSRGIAFGNQGRRLTIGFDEGLLTYDMTDFQRTGFYRLDSTKAVGMSPDGHYLAALDIRGQITLWNSLTNRQLANLRQEKIRDVRENIDFSDDGARLIVSNADTVRIWNLAKAREKISTSGHDGAVTCAAFTKHGNILVTGGKDKTVRYFHAVTGETMGAVQFDEAIQAIAFSPDGNLLAIGSMGRDEASHLHLMDIASRRIVWETAPSFGSVHALSWREGNAGSFLAGCGPSGVRLWRLTGDSEPMLTESLTLHRSWCLAIALDASCRWLVWAQDDRFLHAWDVVEGQEKKISAPPMRQGWHGLAFLPESDEIVYISETGKAEVWSISEDRRVGSFGQSGAFQAPHLTLSANGQWLAALTRPDTVSIWHVPSGEHVFSLRPEPSTVWSLASRSAGRRLAVGRTDGSVAIWDLGLIQNELEKRNLWLKTDASFLPR